MIDPEFATSCPLPGQTVHRLAAVAARPGDSI